MPKHVDPISSEVAPPTAAAADFLAAVTEREDLRENPDARLALYRDACTELSRRMNEAAYLDSCDADDAAHWIAILLKGAQDAWSSVRRVCIDEVGRLLAHENGGRRHHHSLLTSSSSATSEPQGEDTGEEGTLAPLLRELPVQMQTAWRAAASHAWYAREGLLRVYQLLFRPCIGTQEAKRVMSPWRRVVLEEVVLPALSDPQLPVREHAADLLCAVVGGTAATTTTAADETSRDLATVAAERVVATLQRIVDEAAASPLPHCHAAEGEHVTRVVEGYLLAVVRLSTVVGGDGAGGVALPRSGVLQPWEEPLYGLLSHLSAHRASSVRQYVAEALGQPSDQLFIAVLNGLLGAVCRGDAEDGDEGDEEGEDNGRPSTDAPSWQTTETLLMALQQHLVRYLSQGAHFTVDLASLVEAAPASDPHHPAPSALRLFVEALAVVVTYAEASRFEVARMGGQVAPLLLQFLVRFAPRVDEVLVAVADTVERTTAATTWTEVVAPAAWWFTAIRTTTEEGAAGAAVTAPPVVLSESVSRAWRSMLERTASGTSHFSTRLAIAAYFAPERFPSEDAGFYADVSAPLLRGGAGPWAAVLAAPKSRAAERLSWGLDFVFSPAATAAGQSLLALEDNVLPLWMSALPHMMTHQQCILLCMARAVLSLAGAEREGSGGRRRSEVSTSGLFTLFPGAHRPFSFAYRPGLFAAPVTLDGGEDVVLGYTWLKAFFPREEDLPPVLAVPRQQQQQQGEEDEAKSEEGGAAAAGPGVSRVAAEAVLRGCRLVYAAREVVVVEPVVLREVRSLLMALARFDKRAATQVAVVDLVLARLDALLLRASDDGGTCWWTDDASVAASSPIGEEEDTTAAGGGWDDWDDDDGDGDGVGAVEGIAPHEEIHEAATMVKHLLRHSQTAHRAAADTTADTTGEYSSTRDAKIAYLLRF